MIDSLLSSIAALDLGLLKQPPTSALFILALSVVISLVTSISNRMVIDIEEHRRWTIESHRLRQEMMEAMRGGNQRRTARLQKRQQQMMKEQQKMTANRLKLTLLFFVPFILIWQVLRNFIGGVEYIALMPLKVPWIAPQGTLSFSTWYIICSMATNIVISRVLGLTFEIDPSES